MTKSCTVCLCVHPHHLRDQPFSKLAANDLGETQRTVRETLNNQNNFTSMATHCMCFEIPSAVSIPRKTPPSTHGFPSRNILHFNRSELQSDIMLRVTTLLHEN